ncbi:hypothetical protein AgCh_002326 [Apium graveolens]
MGKCPSLFFPIEIKNIQKAKHGSDSGVYDSHGSVVTRISVAAIFINMGLSSKTRPGKFPSLLFPIDIQNIHKGKHGSDTDVYDPEGRFVPKKFKEIFSKHAIANKSALTSDELMAMVKGNREPKNYSGWLASYVEWKILYVLCKDKDGLLHRDTIKAVYDGSLFEQMAKDKAASDKK